MMSYPTKEEVIRILDDFTDDTIEYYCADSSVESWKDLHNKYADIILALFHRLKDDNESVVIDEQQLRLRASDVESVDKFFPLK